MSMFLCVFHRVLCSPIESLMVPVLSDNFFFFSKSMYFLNSTEIWGEITYFAILPHF